MSEPKSSSSKVPICIRVVHCPSHTPVAEVSMQPTDSLFDLRQTIERNIFSNRDCPMRYFTKWYAVKATSPFLFGKVLEQKTEITPSMLSLTLDVAQITDEVLIHLEGLLIDDPESKSMNLDLEAYAQLQGRESELTRKLQTAMARLKTEKARARAEIYLSHESYKGDPLQALWAVMNDNLVEGPDVAVVIATHPSCGLERCGKVDVTSNCRFIALPAKVTNPLNLAILAYRVDIAKALIVAGAQINNRTKVTTAARSAFAVDNGINQSQSGFGKSAFSNSQPPSQFYGNQASSINQGWVPNINAVFPSLETIDALMIAIVTNSGPMVELLTNNGADPLTIYDDEETALDIAIRKQKIEAAVALVRVCKDEKVTTKTLHLAAALGCTSIADALIQKGLDVGQVEDGTGDTALHKASEKGHSKIVHKLLQVDDSKIFTPNAKGDTPLHLAATNGHLDIVQTLLASPYAEINANGSNGSTALHFAVQHRKEPVVRFLLSHSNSRSETCDVDVVDNDGCTALHVAARNGFTVAIKLLLERGCNYKLTNKEGKSALAVAQAEKLKLHFGLYNRPGEWFEVQRLLAEGLDAPI